MSSELSKTIGTCGIWVSVSVALTFGLFREGVDNFGVVMVAGIIMLGATISTVAIWAPEGFAGKNKGPKTRGFEVVQPAQPLDEV
jgi:hypothetical protein